MRKKFAKYGFFAIACCMLTIVGYLLPAPAAESRAKAVKGMAMITTAAKAFVRAKVEYKGKNQECYDAYYGCMDQFCMGDNESGGSCQCSVDYAQYEGKMKTVEKNTDEANRISNIEVEKVKAGANADILFTGKREYDKDGNVVSFENQKANKRRRAAEEMEKMFAEEDDEETSFANLTGKALYDSAREVCLDQVNDVCAGDLEMVTAVFQNQIKSDCKALSMNINDLIKKSEQAIMEANKEVLEARKEVHERDNEFDRGTCMVEFKKCMMGADACGSDWGRCASSVAAENMQNNAAVSTRGTKVSHVSKFDLTDSTKEMLESKRNICESVLNKCQATRDGVWTDFLRDIAPELKIAESKLEANMRGSCLMTISECIQTACKDNIVGKKDSSGNDVPSMDACLARPDMARSFCKVQIDPCERMEPQVWDFVVSKLAAMRVDACTEEVKQCFTSEDRCGADFSKCIGMDFKFLHDMCPVDKLIVCKQSKKDFKMADIDKMLMGFYLNVDNNALELCQKLITEKMEEVCGSTIDCNQFASDDKIGTNSLQPQKVGSTYKITGMISFGSIKIGDGIICDGLEEDDKCDKKKALPVGHVGVKDYIANVRKKNSNMGDNEGIINSIEAELNNIAGKINNTMGMIETDQKIQYCIEGRDLSQISSIEI